MRTELSLCMAALLAAAAVCGAAAQGWLEDFETGTKGSYGAADVTCSMGSWHMDDALIGKLANDKLFGKQSVRIQNSGFISMNFDKSGGAGEISVYFAKYGTDGNATGKIEYSTDGGASWTQAGDTVPIESANLTQAKRILNIGGNIRFRISKTGGNHVNVDDIAITDHSGPPPLAAPVALGATGVSADGFTANWTEVAEAEGYLLDVWQVAITGAVAGVTAFEESFDGFAAGSPDSGASSTDVSGNLDNYTARTGWSGQRVYQAGGTVKMGKSSELGWIMTPEIDLSGHGGTFEISMKACAWSGDSTEFKVLLVNGTETNSLGTVAGLNNDATYTFLAKSVSGSGGTDASKLLFEGMQASKGRFFLEDLVVTQGVVAGAPQTNFVCASAAAGGLSTNLTGLTPGVYYYSVRAEDSERVSANSNVITVDTANPLPPVVDPVAPQMVRLGDTLEFAVTVTPTEGDPVTATNAVAETNVSGAWSFENGLFSFTPVTEDLGEQRFVFSAADKDGTNTMTVIVTVRRAQVQAVVMDAAAGSYTQDFDALATSGTTNEWDNLAWPLPAWSAFAKTTLVTSYRTGTGTGTAVGLYSFGADADRSLGSLTSSSGNPLLYGLAFTNATEQAVTNLSISFTAEQWRVGANADAHTLTFEYCVTNRALPLIEGAWRRVKALCFESPLVTNDTQSSGACYAAARLAAKLPRPVAAGEVVLLRWRDPYEAYGHAFGIDDLAVTWAAGAMPDAIAVGLAGASEDFDEMGGSATEELPWMWRAESRDDAPRVSGPYAAAGTRTALANSVSDFTDAGIYNFTSSQACDRAVGGLADGTTAKSVTLCAKFRNVTGLALRNWDVGYSVEKYRNGTVATAVRLLRSTDGEIWQESGVPTVFAPDADTSGYAPDSCPGANVVEQRRVIFDVPVAKNGVFYLAWQVAVAEGEVTEGAQALGVDDIVVMPRLPRGSVMRLE